MPTPGTNGIVEVTVQLLQTDVPRDFCTNTWSVNTGSSTVTAANWQALSDAFKTFYSAASGSHTLYYTNGISVKVYDRADAKPRPEKAFSNYTPGSWMTTVPMPRQIALCCSFYAGRNLKRSRGRVYLPVNGNWSTGDIPSATTMNNALQFGVQLNALIQALTPSWFITVHSDVDNMDYVVDHFWVNDVYDTQRRRDRKETTRVHSP